MSSVWDPFFGPGRSETVLTSFVSQYLPLPDATLGVTAVGGTQRSRIQPWLVLIYGLVLFGLALTSIVLVLIQVFVVHALCTLCLCSAAISLVNAGLGYDELSAGLRHWQRARVRGASRWGALRR